MNILEFKIIKSLEINKAARLVGISFLTSLILAVIVDDLLISDLIIPSPNSDTLVENINKSKNTFFIGSLLYIMILALDSIIAVALYIVLRPADKTLAVITAYLRLLYVVFVAVILIAFAAEFVEVKTYEIVKLSGYLFFMGHIFIAGLTIYKSKYMPKLLGILLIIASFCYVFAFYVRIVVDIPEALGIVFMLLMAAGEMSLAIWLLVRANKLPDLIKATQN